MKMNMLGLLAVLVLLVGCDYGAAVGSLADTNREALERDRKNGICYSEVHKQQYTRQSLYDAFAFMLPLDCTTGKPFGAK